MTRDDGGYDRRAYLKATTAAVAGAVGLTGCLGSVTGDGGDGSGGDETGTLATRVKDDPGDIADFESCVVTITGYWLGPSPDEAETTAGGTAETEASTTDDGTAADDGTATEGDGTETAEETDDGEGGREYVELDEPAEADLVQLQDGATQLVDEASLSTGSHAFLQLDTDGVDATLESGESATVEIPGQAPLTFNESFEVRADTRTTFTADFTPVQRGQTGNYVLQPVPDGISVAYETVEDDGTDGDDGDGDDADDETTA